MSSKLIAKTVINFCDGDEELSVTYNGLINLQEGDIINLRGSKEMLVSNGNYVIRRGHISNQMTLHSNKPDSIYRYLECEKLS